MSLFNFDNRNTRLVLAGGLLALAGGLLGSGCGGSGGVARIEDFCLALARADCSAAVVQACYGSNDATAATDVQSCISTRSSLTKCNPQHLPYHPEFADGCIAQHEAVYASAQIDGPSLQLLQQACLPVFNRGGSVGTACTDNTDCAAQPDASTSLSCVIHEGAKGTCRVPIPTMGGQKCSDPAAQCDTGLFCEKSGFCVSDPTKGEACSSGISCAMGYRCDTTAKACVDQLPNGSACNVATDCAGGFCIGTTTAGSQCAATYTLAFGSATCLDFTKK